MLTEAVTLALTVELNDREIVGIPEALLEAVATDEPVEVVEDVTVVVDEALEEIEIEAVLLGEPDLVAVPLTLGVGSVASKNI